MGKVISLFNLKGGVGKTTTNVNLSACLAKHDTKILVIDLDPLGNTTIAYGIDKYMTEKTIYNVLLDEVEIDDTIIHTEFENIDLIPASHNLIMIEKLLVHNNDGDMILKNQLDYIKDWYDYIFIDCPPGVNMLSLNGLIASDSTIMPIQCEIYSIECVRQLRETIDYVQSNFNPDLDIEGILLSMFDGRAKLSIEVVDEAKKYFKGSLYTTIIPRNIKLAEAPKKGLPIIYYDAKCKGAEAYIDLAEEFIECNGI